MNTRLLFVDDEPSIRVTLPAILSQEGFDVTVAASVPEGLDLIQREKFHILLTDLNIGSAGDGFLLVSAMRRVQPQASTFILTGFPDFDTALQAIRGQVDDYFTKPANIHDLVRIMKERLLQPGRLRDQPTRRVGQIVREQSHRILELWLAEVTANRKLNSVAMSHKDRIDHLPALIEHLAHGLEAGYEEIGADTRNDATSHGESRATPGFSTSLLVSEVRILSKAIRQVIQENLLMVDLSMLVEDVMKLGEELNALLEESLRAFEQTRSSHVA